MLHLHRVTTPCRAAYPTRHSSVASPVLHVSRRRAPAACRALDGKEEPMQEPAQAAAEEPHQSDSSAIFSTLSAAAQLGSRSGKTNVVFASDDSNDTWRKLDKRVNKYPGQRSFTAIGSNAEADSGMSFRQSMVHAVESVLGDTSVHCECISERQSKRGTYVSVTVGPVWVENGDQVIAIYNAMRDDKRLRYFI